ncbi:flavodoxin family protein [Peptostreptococcus sp. D1]|uniref:flavodoxin family protein n=1 Tax=Peptostreptococcus sp. D1 TaxID=72304 RepID=UPI0015A68647|nr:flavodoxin family protein [Peptostreptococcus sp. D1]
MKKILIVVGSNNKCSKTKKFMENIKKNIENTNKYIVEIILLGDYKIEFCKGCGKCFSTGECSIVDEFIFIKEKMISSEFIILASPVYLNSITGAMKNFFDRLAYWNHLMMMSGKLGFVLSFTGLTGIEETNYFLRIRSSELGIKVLDSFYFIEKIDDIDYKSHLISKKVIESIECNYGHSNYNLEENFNYYKEFYCNKTTVEDLGHSDNEIKFWNQDWIKKVNSYQEFVMEINKLRRK